MKLSVEEFRHWKNPSITLLGMSGVGKTHLSALLRRNDWFHYSGDYRIGTRYLDEHGVRREAAAAVVGRDVLRERGREHVEVAFERVGHDERD